MPILVVGDVETNLIILSTVLAGMTELEIVTRTSPVDALWQAQRTSFDLILVDYLMPEMDGLEFIRRVREIPEHRDTPIVMVTTADQRTVRIEALEVGATDFLSKPIDVPELKVRARNLLRLAAAQARLRHHAVELRHEVNAATEALAKREEEIIFRLSRAAEYRDLETGEHISRMAVLCQAIARMLGHPETFCREMFLAAPMHDVGKIGVSDTILLKPGPLTPEERAEMQKHARIGHEILSGSSSRLIEFAAEIALTHHERWDGGGYPRGLKGEEIPISGRITAVADVCDALLSTRPYKKAWSFEAVREHLRQEAGGHFDPACAGALLARWDELRSLYGAEQEARKAA